MVYADVAEIPEGVPLIVEFSAEVGVFDKHEEALVEPANLAEHVTADHHEGGGHCLDRFARVVSGKGVTLTALKKSPA